MYTERKGREVTLADEERAFMPDADRELTELRREIVEARNQVCDQPVTGVCDLGSEPGHKKVERDGRDHELAGRIHTDRLRRTSASSEDPSEVLLVEVGCLPEVGDYPGNDAAPGNVPQ